MGRDANKSLPNKKGLNIFILHAPWNDRGDEAAIRAMIDSLSSELPVSKMRIMIMCKNVTQFPYDNIEIIEFPLSIEIKLFLPIVRVLRNLFQTHPVVNGIINKPLRIGYSIAFATPIYLDILLMLLTFGKLSFTRQGREFIKAVDEADVVIHAPGGPDIGDLYGNILVPLLPDFVSLSELLISKVFKKKPFFIYAPSMGPFSRRFANFIRRPLLKRADVIIVREETSARYLKEELGLDSYITMDSALQNDIPEDYVSKYTTTSEVLNIIENEKVIGITVADLKWHPIYQKYSGLREKIKNSFVDLIRYSVTKRYVILLIPILFGELQDVQDVGLLDDIYSLIRKEKETEGKIFLLPSDIDAYAQQVIISKLFCVISVRYHGTVFSAKGEVPFIPVCYEHKTKGFVQKIGLTDVMIDVEEVSGNKLIDKFTYLEENYDIIKEQLKSKVPLLKEESRKTTKIILEKLRSEGLV